MNWRGKPLVSLAAVVNLIDATTTASGLRVRSEIDTRSYPQGVRVTDEQMQSINLSRHEFHGDWKYTIRPTAPINVGLPGFVWMRPTVARPWGRQRSRCRLTR